MTDHKARATDPATSHAAAARSGTFAGTHKARILQALQHGPLTTAAIASASGLTVVQVDRRACELERAGHIEYMRNKLGEFSSADGYRVWRLAEPG
jgi:predicted Rossmann fold nucleotide-binding protein DprA/Smf involved in DNA uptake